MKIQLSRVEATVGCKHYNPEGEDAEAWRRINSDLNLPQRRCTTAWLKVGDTTLRSLAVCQPPDQFCKRTGRLLAAKRLIRGMLGFTKADRKAVFLALCPEFRKGASRGAE